MRFLLALSLALPLAAAPVKVLILSGANNHDWRATTPHLRRILTATGKFDVRVVEEPSTVTAKVLAGYDAVLVDYVGPRWGEPAEAAIDAFVKGGKGLIVVHGSSYPFGVREVLGDRAPKPKFFEKPWPAWGEMVGATWTENPRTGHGKRHAFEVKWLDGAHPIAAGMAPSFWITDELYHLFQMKPGVKVIADAMDAKEMNGTGKREPILWVREYGKGRVFHTALGHDMTAQMAPGFITTLARGTEWAATGAVTLPPAVSLDPKNSDAVRVLLVVGGHVHDPSLYDVFERQRDIRLDVDPHPAAYSRDLVKNYDVIALYDMVQEVPPAQQKRLREYLELGGKGLVVMHHALADFQNWEWWWKEVVGGRYLLKPDLGMPGSTYKHDIEMSLTPVAEHPVVKGLTPSRILDEGYKGQWMSPNNKVLVEATHEASDKPVVWITPYQKARVVVVQLGHDRHAHENPWYRQLVRQSVLWAGGRAN
jgi:type 1 glutamine amidotransferase